MSSSTQLQFSREIAPSGNRVWVRKQEDEKATLVAEVAQWFENVKETEAQFQEHVYANSDLKDLDLRQHRLCLHGMLAAGENLAMSCILWGGRMEKLSEIKPIIVELEKKMRELFKVLLEWHGGTEIQSDVPESFKGAAKEFSDGKIVPFEEPK